jgi:hypothetical protein
LFVEAKVKHYLRKNKYLGRIISRICNITAFSLIYTHFYAMRSITAQPRRRRYRSIAMGVLRRKRSIGVVMPTNTATSSSIDSEAEGSSTKAATRRMVDEIINRHAWRVARSIDILLRRYSTTESMQRRVNTPPAII